MENIRWGIGKLQSGEWTTDEFAEFIDMCYKIVEEEHASVRSSYEGDEGFKRDERRMVRGCEEGFGCFLAGLEELAAYADDEDEAHLQRGLDLYKKGNRLMNEVLFYLDDALEEVEIRLDL